MSLLIDVSAVPECGCNHAIEHLHKALSGEDGLAHDIWAEHESPFIRDLIEKFSKRGLTKIAKVQEALAKWIAGDFYTPSVKPAPVPPGFMGRWSAKEMALVRTYLENIPPGSMTLDDWSMVVDYTVQRYLPANELNEEAEWLTTKAHLMGKVQAHLSAIEAGAASSLATALPATVSEATIMFKLSDAEAAILSYGKARACDQVQAISEFARHSIKRVVLDFQSRKLAGDPTANPGALQQALFDKFDSMNRDWRRIAITEAGEMANQGVILSLPKGSRVRRMEQYHGACAFCKKLDGRVFRVTDAADEKKDGSKDVWPGKTNVGRSSAAYKRVGAELIERLPAERWWPAAGTQHPHCRGRWEPMQAATHDEGFAAFLRKRYGIKEGME